VKQGPALENLTAAILDICRSGVPPEVLRTEVLSRLRRAVSVDAVWWATADPATLLPTQPYTEEIPADTLPYFVQNEFLDDDVNKWTELVREAAGVRTLFQATAGDVLASSRYRDIFRPLGLADELRAVFRVQDAVWGYMCLHREAHEPFSDEEAAYVQRLAPHIGEAIRTGLLLSSVDRAELAEAPGLVVVGADGSVVGVTGPGERWLEELDCKNAVQESLPAEIYALAAMLRRGDAAETVLPRLRLRTSAGRWVVLHASRMPADGENAVAVIIEQASPLEIAPVVMLAYGLTKQERAVTGLVCRGLSTREIAHRLFISTNTVQDHLKSIFSKTGVRSRRELVATILNEQYLPRIMTGQPLGPTGFFSEPDGAGGNAARG